MRERKVHRPRYGSFPYLKPRAAKLLFNPDHNGRRARAGFKLTLLQRLGLVAEGTYITGFGKIDGIGSQLYRMLATRAFARAVDIPYAHTPLETVAERHKVDSSTFGAWEQLVGLGNGFPFGRELGLPMIRCAQYTRSPAAWRAPCVIWDVAGDVYLNSYPAAFFAEVERVRERYLPAPRKSVASLSVAVHLRRGDVDAAHFPQRYTADRDVLATIGALLSAVREIGLQARVVIYSVGDPEEFREFEARGFAVQLNRDPLADFIAMKDADILVTAKSAFSYLAGLINPSGLVVYERFWHPPRPDWVTIGGRDFPQRLQDGLSRHFLNSAALTETPPSQGPTCPHA